MAKKESLNPFSNESLAQFLESLDFEWFGDEAKQFIKVDKLPLTLAAILPLIPKFALNGYIYHFKMGSLFRAGEKIKARPKSVSEEIAYWIDSKIPVYMKDLKKKIDELGAEKQ